MGHRSPIIWHSSESWHMGKVHDFRDLIVWQRAMQLARCCFHIVTHAPRSRTRSLTAQILRAADSVSANIAEGHSRPHRGEYLHFLGVAYASLKELESHLMTLQFARGLDSPEVERALRLADECSRMLTVLRRRLVDGPGDSRSAGR